jgi:hypothetical protein
MPRQPRDDFEPRILLPDTSAEQRLARDAIDDVRYNTLVYDKTQPIGREGRMTIFDAFNDRLQELRDMGIKLEEGLLNFMIQQCVLADSRIARDSHGNAIAKGELFEHRLVSVGCRMHMTQVQIANQYGLDRTTVGKHIKMYRDWYFIVNSGQGWYEFDAALCWRGDIARCAAYREVQIVRDGITFVDSGGAR